MTVLVLSMGFGFFPVYLCRDNTIYLDGLQYRQDPLTNWQPTGEKYKVANLCGDVPFFTFISRYTSDDNQYFIYMYTFPADAERMPYRRTDVALPAFSADVIDSVILGIGEDMIPGNTEYTELTITDKETIGDIAGCFSRPVEKDAAKEIVRTTVSMTAQSNPLKNMTYEISAVVYDGKYCFMQKDGNLFEIPVALLEEIFHATIYTPEQYIVATRE